MEQDGPGHDPPDQGGDSLAPIILVAAALFPLLAALRHLDDNSLASWNWALTGRDAVGLWVAHLAVVAVAATLSRCSLQGRLGLAAVVAVAFAAGLAPALAGEPEAVIDASRYFVQAKHLDLEGLSAFFSAWGRAIPAWTDLPLPALLYGAVFRVCGEHRVAIQIFSAGLFALTVYATARIGRLLWDEGTGVYGALLLLAVPYLLVNVPLLMADLPATCAVTVALWAFLEACERGGAPRIAAAGLATGLALLAKYSTWVLLAGTLCCVLALDAAQRRWPAVGRGLAAASLGALFPALFALAYPDVVQRQLTLLRGFQWEGLSRWVESYPSTFLFQSHPLLVALALVALWQAWRRRDPRVLVAAAVPLVLFALQARRSRYLLPLFPPLALLAARGLWALGGPRRRRFTAIAAVGFSLVTVLALFVPFLRWTNTANLLAAGRFLDERGVAVAEVSMAGTPGLDINPEVALPLLDYHTAARVVLRESTAVRPTGEQLRTNSFRFTWVEPMPAWYRTGEVPTAGAAQVLITGDPVAALPAGLAARVGGRPPDAVFARDAVYRFRTLVRIWLPQSARNTLR